MTKILPYLYSIAILLHICQPDVHGALIGIPEPKSMLKKAEVVGVASLRKQSGQWSIKFSRILKGQREPEIWIPLTSSSHMDLDFFGKMVDKQQFLFLGVNDPKADALFPAFWMVSAWPQGKPRDSRLETLEGSIRFAEAVFAEETPKGENTMAENAFLPPMLSEEKLNDLRAEQELEAAQEIQSRRVPPKQDIGPKASASGDETPPQENRPSAIDLGAPIPRESKVTVFFYFGFGLVLIFLLWLAFFLLKRK